MESNYNPKDDEYIETLVVNGKMINVFLSDSGQCYWFQFLDGDKLKSAGCGTYNSEYKEEIEEYFKPEVEKLNDRINILRDELHALWNEIELLRKEDKNVSK